MASSSVTYPYPSEINVGDFVTIKLSQINYFVWRQMMLGLIESQSLVGFINGKTPVPPERINVPDDNSTTGMKETENPDYQAWKRSDRLVQRWILATLSEDLLPSVMHLKTAKDLWTMLERGFTQPFVHEDGIVRNQPTGKDLSRYLPLYKAALKGDWESARIFFEQEPDAVSAIITAGLETTLIVAARSAKHFVEKLVELMSPADLALADFFGMTALHVAARAGNIEAAKFLVSKNPHLPNSWDLYESLPLHHAAVAGLREMVLYLLTVTEADTDPRPFENESGVKLVHALIGSGLYDVSLYVVERYPNLAWMDPSPLRSLSLKPSAFPSGTRLNFWQRIIYSCVPMMLENFAKQRRGVPQIKHILDIKLTHNQALQLLKHLCTEIAKLDHVKASSILGEPLRYATFVGNHEVVEEIFASFPGAIYLTSEKRQTFLHLAVVYRRENVFNLIYQFHDEIRYIFFTTPDVLANNALHLAGYLESQQKLNLRAGAAGAALQMQRELQWYKEVEKFTLPQDKEQMNTTGKTPWIIFTETHEDLAREGEQWMKDRANSCTIVAALVATVVFAAAITVPGGNNGESGHPIFSIEKAFIIFGISDALALFSSTTSMLMFLSILTSRYALEDFLFSLPRRLIIGLTTLFLSILFMMIAFSATLYLVFGDKKAWFLIPVVALACLPVTLFAFLQFPFLLDMIKSTYGPGIFGKQSDHILF